MTGPKRNAMRAWPKRRRFPRGPEGELRWRLACIAKVLRSVAAARLPDPNVIAPAEIVEDWAAHRFELFAAGKVRTLDAAFAQPGRKRGPKGDPNSTLARAVRVLELKRVNPRRSWKAIADQLAQETGFAADAAYMQQLHTRGKNFEELRTMTKASKPPK